MEVRKTEFESEYATVFYVGVVATLAILVVSVALLLQSAGLIFSEPGAKPLTIGALLGHLWIEASIIYFWSEFNRKVPVIECDKDGITLRRLFSRQFFPWSEARSTVLIGHEYLRFMLIPTNHEVTTLVFSSGKVQVLVDWYANSADLRQYLKGRAPGEMSITAPEFDLKLPKTAREDVDPAPRVSSEEALPDPITELGTEFDALTNSTEPGVQRFGGALLLSFNGWFWLAILYLSIRLGFGTAADEGWSLGRAFMGLLLFGWITLLLSLTMNYFEITEKKLIVRNHLIFWRRVVYSFSEISDAYVKPAGRAGYALCVTSRNFDEKKYSGATLSNRKWQALENALRGNGFRVSQGIW